MSSERRDFRCDSTETTQEPVAEPRTRSILQRIGNLVERKRDARARAEMADGAQLRWWLVYGPVRSGTSLALQILRSRAKLYVSDWGLGAMLRLTHDESYVRFDRDRALRDISRNVLDNAYPGDGDTLDLVYKEALLDAREAPALTRMWGAPERTIFCFREPSSYIASAVRKFPGVSLAALQNAYSESLAQFESIGGQAFEYHPEVTEADYIAFLKPLELPSPFPIVVRYEGRESDGDVTPGMRDAYHRLIDHLAADPEGGHSFLGNAR